MRELLLVVASVSAIALAQGIVLDPSRRLEFVDCPVQGGDGGAAHAGVLTEGSYLFRVTGEQTNVCFHTYGTSFTGTLPDAGSFTYSYPTGCLDGGTCWHCADGGEVFPSGTVMLWSVPRGGQAVSCRSFATDAGDVTWTRAH